MSTKQLIQKAYEERNKVQLIISKIQKEIEKENHSICHEIIDR